MANKARIDFELNYKVNQQSLNQVRSALQNLSNIGVETIETSNIKEAEKILEEAINSANQLDTALQKAFDVDLGTINLTKFNNELKNINLQDIYNKMSAIGTEGQEAFQKVAAAALNVNTQFKTTHTLLDTLKTSLANTIIYNISQNTINAVTGSVSQAIGYVKNLDKSLNDIRIVTGMSADDMERFAVEANKAAISLSSSTKDIAEGALIYYQQGDTSENAMYKAQVTQKAANVSGIDAGTMSDYLTAIWNGYQVAERAANEGMKVYDEYADKIASVAATTASDFNEVATAMGKVAPLANSMGISFDELTAQISAVVSVTRQAPETVGTALRTIYTRMADLKAGGEDEGVTLGKVSGGLAGYGINVLDSTGDLREMGDVIDEVAAKWDTWDKATQRSIAVLVAGTRQVNIFTSLMESWESQYLPALDTATNKSAGSLDQMQEVYAESVEATAQRAKAAWEGVYGSLLDENAIKMVSQVSEGIAKVVKTIVDGLGGGGTVFPLLIGLVGQLTSGVISNKLAEIVTQFKQVGAQSQQIKAWNETVANFRQINDAGVQEMADYANQFTKYASLMNEEQRERMSGLQKETEELRLQKQEWNKNVTAAQELKDELKDVENLRGVSTNIRNQFKAGSSFSKQYSTGKEANLDNLFEGDVLNAIEQSNEIGEKINQIQEKYNAASGEDAENVQIRINAYNELKNVMLEYADQLDNTQNILDANENKQKEYENSLENIKEKTESFTNELDLSLQIQQWIQVGSAVTQAAGAIQGLKNIVNTLEDDSLSGLEKILQITVSLGTTLPTLANSYKVISTTFSNGKSFKENFQAGTFQKVSENRGTASAKEQLEIEEKIKKIKEQQEEIDKKLKDIAETKKKLLIRNETLNAKYLELEKKKKEINQKLEDGLIDQSTALNAQIGLQSKINGIIEEREEITRDLQDLQEQEDAAIEEKSTIDSALSAAETAFDELDVKIGDLSLSSLNLSEIFAGLKAGLAGGGWVGLLVALIPAAIALVDALTTSAQEAAEAFNEQKDNLEELQNKLEEYEEKLKANNEEIRQLQAKDELTKEDENRIEQLQDENNLIRKQIELQTSLVEKQKEATAEAAQQSYEISQQGDFLDKLKELGLKFLDIIEATNPILRDSIELTIGFITHLEDIVDGALKFLSGIENLIPKLPSTKSDILDNYERGQKVYTSKDAADSKKFNVDDAIKNYGDAREALEKAKKDFINAKTDEEKEAAQQAIDFSQASIDNLETSLTNWTSYWMDNLEHLDEESQDKVKNIAEYMLGDDDTLKKYEVQLARIRKKLEEAKPSREDLQKFAEANNLNIDELDYTELVTKYRDYYTNMIDDIQSKEEEYVQQKKEDIKTVEEELEESKNNWYDFMNETDPEKLAKEWGIAFNETNPFDTLIKSSSDFVKALDSVTNKTKKAKDAIEEYNDNGEISIQTALELIETDASFADALDFSTGKITLQTEKLKELVKQKYEDIKADLIRQQQYAKELAQKITTDFTEATYLEVMDLGSLGYKRSGYSTPNEKSQKISDPAAQLLKKYGIDINKPISETDLNKVHSKAKQDYEQLKNNRTEFSQLQSYDDLQKQINTYDNLINHIWDNEDEEKETAKKEEIKLVEPDEKELDESLKNWAESWKNYLDNLKSEADKYKELAAEALADDNYELAQTYLQKYQDFNQKYLDGLAKEASELRPQVEELYSNMQGLYSGISDVSLVDFIFGEESKTHQDEVSDFIEQKIKAEEEAIDKATTQAEKDAHGKQLNYWKEVQNDFNNLLAYAPMVGDLEGFESGHGTLAASWHKSIKDFNDEYIKVYTQEYKDARTEVKDEVSRINDEIALLDSDDYFGKIELDRDILAQYQLTQAEIDKERAKLAELEAQGYDTTEAIKELDKSQRELDKDIKRVNDDMKSQASAMQDAMINAEKQAISDLDNYYKEQFDNQQDIIDGIQDEIDAIDETIDARKKAQEAEKERVEEAKKQLEKYKEVLQDIWDAEDKQAERRKKLEERQDVAQQRATQLTAAASGDLSALASIQDLDEQLKDLDEEMQEDITQEIRDSFLDYIDKYSEGLDETLEALDKQLEALDEQKETLNEQKEALEKQLETEQNWYEEYKKTPEFYDLILQILSGGQFTLPDGRTFENSAQMREEYAKNTGEIYSLGYQKSQTDASKKEEAARKYLPLQDYINKIYSGNITDEEKAEFINLILNENTKIAPASNTNDGGTSAALAKVSSNLIPTVESLKDTSGTIFEYDFDSAFANLSSAYEQQRTQLNEIISKMDNPMTSWVINKVIEINGNVDKSVMPELRSTAMNLANNYSETLKAIRSAGINKSK